MALAVIVGANRGIGLGLAREFRGRGFGVIGTARDPAKATALTGSGAQAEKLDVNDPAQIDAFVAHLKNRAIDILVLNAGVSGPGHGSAQQATAAETGALFYTNAIAPLRLAQGLAPSVEQTGGVIAFMSSVLGSVSLNTGGGMELYRASKAALNSLTRSFAAEHSGKKITVLTLHPGWVRTDMGGAGATLDVETSTKGLASVLTAAKGRGGHQYIDYAGNELTW